MEPRIQYATTEDGVSIAYCEAGEGSPLVWVPEPPLCHLQLEWSDPMSTRAKLAERGQFSVIAYDARGSGLSDRDVDDLSMTARLLDVEAVTGRLGLDEFAIAGTTWGAGIAAAYASAHPQQVTHLLLVNALSQTGMGSGRNRVFSQMLRLDWEMFTENVGALEFGWGAREASEFAQFVRACVSHEEAMRWYGAMSTDDVSDLLPTVEAPTLLVYLSGLSYMSENAARKLAVQVPNGSLVILEGTHRDNDDNILKAIEGFVNVEHVGATESAEPSGFHTILFSDVEGSTALTDRLGDSKARELLREHERITREALKAHGGSEVKTMGDGFMTSFGSATKALECAIAIQRAFAEHNDSAEEPIKVRIGLNAGEPIAEDEDLFGTTVNMAARICSKADSGQILAPIVVRELVAGKGFLFADRGETDLRGFEDPVRLYEVRWGE